jgi:ubiquinone biosynthesis accessory factor UbiJ
VLLQTLATLVNRNIAASSRARTLCERLEGRTLGVRIEGFLPIDVFAHVEDRQLRLSRDAPRDPDAAIAGTPLALAALIGPGAAERMRSGAVAITGDAEIAQTFHELLHAARPELEEELSRLVGDVTARQLGNFARAAAGWGEKSLSTLAQNVSEYLQEESRDLVTRTEAGEFLTAVDELREAVDRIEARIARIGEPRA